MEQITYQQVLADIYDENAKDILALHDETTQEVQPEDKYEDQLEKPEEFQKPVGSHALASLMPSPQQFEDKTKLSVVYDKQTQTRIINIDSRFRDNFSTSSSSNFLFKLREPIKNVISVRLSSIELPNTFYSFSKSRGNTTFYVTYPSASYVTPGTKLLVTIPDGNWDASTYDSTAPILANSTSIIHQLATRINNTVSNTTNNPIIATLPPSLQAPFIVLLNPTTGLLTIQVPLQVGPTPTIPFDIDFTPDALVFQDRTSDWGLGYNLGYRNLQYTNQTAILGTGILNTVDTNYVFVTLDPDWKVIIQETPDKTQLYSFAKVVANTPKFSVIFDNGSNTLTKEYFLQQPTNIISIPVRLSDPYDQDLNLNGADFSISLELKEVIDYSLYETMRS